MSYVTGFPKVKLIQMEAVLNNDHHLTLKYTKWGSMIQPRLRVREKKRERICRRAIFVGNSVKVPCVCSKQDSATRRLSRDCTAKGEDGSFVPLHLFDTIAFLILLFIFVEKYLCPLIVDTRKSGNRDKTYHCLEWIRQNVWLQMTA